MIRISQLKLKPGQEMTVLEKKIRKQLHLRMDQKFTWTIFKKSLDARKKPEIYEIYGY